MRIYNKIMQLLTYEQPSKTQSRLCVCQSIIDLRWVLVLLCEPRSGSTHMQHVVALLYLHTIR